MGTVNVNRSVTDVFYRYKMPRIAAKVEGKGNGIKTVIVNMAEVAKAIGRPATYPTKYFGCELGAQTQFDHKVCRLLNREIDFVLFILILCFFVIYRTNVSSLMVRMMQRNFKIYWMVLFVNSFCVLNVTIRKLTCWYRIKNKPFPRVVKLAVSMDHWKLHIR